MTNTMNLYEATVVLPNGLQVKASTQAIDMTMAQRILTAQYPPGSWITNVLRVLSPTQRSGY
jgi:hypothetical protein